MRAPVVSSIMLCGLVGSLSPLAAGQATDVAATCDATRSVSVALNTTSKACDCKAGWAGLGCDVCTDSSACKDVTLPSGKAAGGCNTRTYMPAAEVRGLCQAPSQNISNLIHGKGWVSMAASANGTFSFDFIKQNVDSKFVPLFRCASKQMKASSVDGKVKYTAPDLACTMTCTVGADRTCTTILSNILKQVGKDGGAVVACEPAKGSCVINESTLDTFLGGVSTNNCQLGECVETMAARMLRA